MINNNLKCKNMNFSKAKNEDDEIQSKLIASGISRDEIIKYFEIKKDYIIENKEKINDAIIQYGISSIYIISGLAMTSDWRFLSLGVGSALVFGGTYRLVKGNKYASDFYELNKKYQITKN